jgi:4-hydroxybenzoate polyprenyltransferase
LKGLGAVMSGDSDLPRSHCRARSSELGIMASTLAYPLAVDLDGALLKTDCLVECLVMGLLRSPLKVARALPVLSKGEAEFKRRMSELGVLNVESLPLREDFVQFLEEQQRKGRDLHLVTTADQMIAERVAAHTGLFRSAEGSRGISLQGAIEEARLRERFPDGFAYAGDGRTDLRVWQAAKSIVLVGASAATRRAALHLGRPIEREFAAARPKLRDWLKSIRVHQWTKNLLLFVPLILAHAYTNTSALLATFWGFVCLSAVASGTYLLNDLCDLESDRLHIGKRDRPIARGDVGAASALLASIALICSGFAVAAAIGNWRLAALLGVYIVFTLAYSLQLKRVPMLDVFLLGSLYTLRIFMGMVLIAAAPSPWLLAFSLFFFFSLAMAKRHAEIVREVGSGQDGWVRGRGYHANDEPLMLTFGVASGLAAVLIMFLYVANDAYPAGAYRHPQWLWLIGFFMYLWLMRIWLLSHRGKLKDDPVEFAVRDPISHTLGVLVLGVFVCALL